jgi:DNA topoisomerase-2
LEVDSGPQKTSKDGKVGIKKNCWRTTGVLVECSKGCDVMFTHRDKGTLKVVNKRCKGEKGWWHITDLPVGYWTEKFATEIKYLESGIPPKGTKRPKLENRCILDYRQYSTSNKVHFMIKPAKGWEPSIDDTLSMMSTTKSLANMVTIDNNSYPTRYKSAESILEKWCPERLTYYILRLEYNISLEKENLKKATNKLKYVKAINAGNLDMDQTDVELAKEMEALGLERICTKKGMDQGDDGKGGSEGRGEDGDEDIDTKGYGYLLSMQTRGMTSKRIESLEREIEAIKEKINDLRSTKPKEMWLKEIVRFEKAYVKFVKENPLY